MPNPRFHDNSASASRCSTTEHRNDLFVLGDRLRCPRPGLPSLHADDGDLRLRTLRVAQETAMTCAAISYFTAVLGALVGFFVANLFRVGGRCPPGGRRPS